MVVNGQLRQELPTLFNTYVRGMTFIVKQNKVESTARMPLLS
jgi:hypothetical protein